jgi:RecJ-like exonuclease
VISRRRPKCPVCLGEGKLLAPFCDVELHETCPVCDGTGHDNSYTGEVVLEADPDELSND